MAATPASIILADSPLLYWPLNDAASGTIVSAQEVIQDPGVFDMVEVDVWGTTTMDNSQKPVWGSLHTRCLGANFMGNSSQNPTLHAPQAGSGLISKRPWVSYSGLAVDPLLIGVTTWAAEGWMATPDTTNLNYDFFGSGFSGDLSANCCWYPYHGEGHPNDNRPPTGFGLNMGTNGFQLLGHHGAYLRGDNGSIVLSDKFEHHIVVNCRDNGDSTQDFFVYVDGTLVMSDLTWGHDSNLYPILPPVGIGIGPYMTYFGSVRHFAVYNKMLTADRIAAHFAHITCQQAAPPVLAGEQVWTDGRFDEEFTGAVELGGTLQPASTATGTTQVVVVPWNATGWKYRQVNTDTAVPNDCAGTSFGAGWGLSSITLGKRISGSWTSVSAPPGIEALGVADAYSVEAVITAKPTGSVFRNTFYYLDLYAGYTEGSAVTGAYLETDNSTTTLYLLHNGTIILSSSIGATPQLGDDVKVITDFTAGTVTAEFNGSPVATLNLAGQTWYTADGSLSGGGTPADYSAVAYDDSAWPVGQTPMGTDGETGHDFDAFGGYNTFWHTDTRMWLRRRIGPLPIGSSTVTVSMRVDNWGSFYWNGTHFYGDSPLSGGGTVFTANVPANLIDGVNLLVVRATDDGFPSADPIPAQPGDKAVIDVEVVAQVSQVDCGVVGDDNGDWPVVGSVIVGWRDSVSSAWHYAHVDQARWDVGIADAISYEFTVRQAGGSGAQWACGESSFNYFGTNGIILELSPSPALNLYHRGVVAQTVAVSAPVVGDDVKIVTDFGTRKAQYFRNGSLQATLDFAAQTWYTADGSAL